MAETIPRAKRNIMLSGVRTECNETNGIIKAHVGWMEGPIMAGVTYTPEQYKTKVFPKPSELIPDRFCLKFVRHWNPDPTSNSLEPNNPKIRWENEISQLIRRYKLQDMPWVKEWQPLDRNDPQWIPSPEEVRAERKAEEADRLRQRQEINRANQEKYFRDHPGARRRSITRTTRKNASPLSPRSTNSQVRTAAAIGRVVFSVGLLSPGAPPPPVASGCHRPEGGNQANCRRLDSPFICFERALHLLEDAYESIRKNGGGDNHGSRSGFCHRLRRYNGDKV
ncbi:MAG: hypothetical protein U1F77_13105 [Kiritimatiellia bacterium]